MEILKVIGRQLRNILLMGSGIALTMLGIHEYNRESGYTDYIRGK